VTERDVSFEEVAGADQVCIDEAYTQKYARHAGTYVEAMVSPVARATTLRLLPR
jgi:hypothetical protein